MTAQTFRPSAKRLVGPALTVAAFLAWAVAAFVLVPRAGRPNVAGSLVLLSGLPLLLALVNAVLLLGLMARVILDDEALTVAGPLGTRRARWADVVGWDIVGTAKGGVSLDLRNGKRLGVPYLAHEGDALRRAVDVRLRRLPPPDVEGRAFRMASRVGLATFLVGGMALLGIVGATTAMPGPRPFWALWGLLTLVALGLSAVLLADRVTLQGGVLTGQNPLGTRRLALADVTNAELRLVRGKGDPRESLVLTGPVTFRLTANREGYAMLRDAIVRAFPPGVRPKPLA